MFIIFAFFHSLGTTSSCIDKLNVMASGMLFNLIFVSAALDISHQVIIFQLFNFLFLSLLRLLLE